MKIEHLIICEYLDKIEQFRRTQSAMWMNNNGWEKCGDKVYYAPHFSQYSYIFLIDIAPHLRIVTAKITDDMCEKIKRIPWKWDDERFHYYVEFSDFDWTV